MGIRVRRGGQRVCVLWELDLRNTFSLSLSLSLSWLMALDSSCLCFPSLPLFSDSVVGACRRFGHGQLICKKIGRLGREGGKGRAVVCTFAIGSLLSI